MKILILGSAGQLGASFQKEYGAEALYFNHSNLDICNYDDLKNKLTNLNPNVIINCAAYTNVDNSENDKNVCFDVNAKSLEFISEISKTLNIFLVHFSTDYIFSGDNKLPYTEYDAPSPLNYYGESKLAGESFIRKSGCNYMILRISSVYSEFGKNFFKTIVNKLKNNENLSIVSNQYMAPTYAPDIAVSVKEILKKINFQEEFRKTFNYCGDDVLSWYEFAIKIKDQFSSTFHDAKSDIKMIDDKTLKLMATRPKYSALNPSKIFEEFKIRPSSVDLGISSSLRGLTFKNKNEKS